MVNGQKEEIPGAKKVEIPGFEGYEFFAARLNDPATNPEKEYKTTPQRWCVYHESGKSLWWDDTKAKAVAGAEYRLNGIERTVAEELLRGASN